MKTNIKHKYVIFLTLRNDFFHWPRGAKGGFLTSHSFSLVLIKPLLLLIRSHWVSCILIASHSFSLLLVVSHLFSLILHN